MKPVFIICLLLSGALAAPVEKKSISISKRDDFIGERDNIGSQQRETTTRSLLPGETERETPEKRDPFEDSFNFEPAASVSRSVNPEGKKPVKRQCYEVCFDGCYEVCADMDWGEVLGPSM